MSKQADEDLNFEAVNYPEGTRFIGPGNDVVISAAVLKANYTPSHLVEQQCFVAQAEEAKYWNEEVIGYSDLRNNDRKLNTRILSRLGYLKAQLTNLQNKEDK